MSNRTLNETIEEALMIPAKDFKTELQLRIKDYFAHEIMRYQHKLITEKALDPDSAETILNGFFAFVFKKG